MSSGFVGLLDVGGYALSDSYDGAANPVARPWLIEIIRDGVITEAGIESASAVGSARHCDAGDHLRSAQDVTKDGVEGVRGKEEGEGRKKLGLACFQHLTHGSSWLGLG